MPVMKSNNIILLEGMDMVGKNTFVNKMIPKYYTLYECNHDLTDKTIGRDNSWAIGYGIIDYLKQITSNPELLNMNVVISRGVFSSYVYARLYNNKYIDPEILKWYANDGFFHDDIDHIYIRHHDADTAKYIFEESQQRAEANNEINRKYDQFNSFSDYWVYYNTADQLFREVYDKIGIKPRIFETLPNFQWEEVL